MPRYDVPKLADYSGAIQANQSMANAFSSLGNQSQDYLKLEEQKNQNQWEKAFKNDSLALETNKYKDSLQEKADTKSANIGTMKALYPTEYGNLSSTMGNNPNLLGNVDIGNVQTYNTNIAKANKDKEDALYQAGRDKVNDGFERERISIQRQNANKPSEIDRIMSILSPTIKLGANSGQDVNIPKDNNQGAYQNTSINPSAINSTAFVQPQAQQQINPQVVPQAQQPLNVGASNQQYGRLDYLTKGAEDTLKEANGDVYKSNPLTGTSRLIEKAPEKSTLETTKLKNELNDETISIQSTIKNTEKSLDKINGIINNPSLGYATGALSFLGNIPGTSMKDIQSEIEIIKSGAFMAGIESMKGFGALSDAEGKQVGTAIANLDIKQSPEHLKKQLGYINDMVSQGKANAIQKLKNRGIDYKSDRQEHTDEDILKALNGSR